MNLTSSRPAIALSIGLSLALTSWAQIPELSSKGTGAEMMTELMRLTMVPLAEEPLAFRGHLAYELTRSGQTSVGEMRWDPEGGALLWTDALDSQGQYTVQLSPSQPLATLALKTNEGIFMTEQMMQMAGYWSEDNEPRGVKAEKNAEPTEVMGKVCTPWSGKEGKSRVTLWMADVSQFNWSESEINAARNATASWLHSQPNTPVLRNLELPAGVPLKADWGVPAEDGALPFSMQVLTLNPSAPFTLDAANVWMHVPGRDINQVAKEMKEQKAGAGN
jgi:hypothetical protein